MANLSSADHDLLIELKTDFRSFVRQYSIDMKNLNEGVTAKLAEHTLALEDHEKRLDGFDAIITTLKAYWISIGIVGGVVFFILTQIPGLLRSWGIL